MHKEDGEYIHNGRLLNYKKECHLKHEWNYKLLYQVKKDKGQISCNITYMWNLKKMI